MIFQFPLFQSQCLQNRRRIPCSVERRSCQSCLLIQIRNRDSKQELAYRGVRGPVGTSTRLRSYWWIDLGCHVLRMASCFNPITADWTYIRWLGDRKGHRGDHERRSTRLSLTAKRTSVAGSMSAIRSRSVVCSSLPTANNHYAGHGPATIEQFRDLWYSSGLPELERGRRMRLQTSLFDDPPTR